jgi:hypothetical protein
MNTKLIPKNFITVKTGRKVKKLQDWVTDTKQLAMVPPKIETLILPEDHQSLQQVCILFFCLILLYFFLDGNSDSKNCLM